MTTWIGHKGTHSIVSCSARDTSPRDFCIITLTTGLVEEIRQILSHILQQGTLSFKQRKTYARHWLNTYKMVIWFVQFSREDH